MKSFKSCARWPKGTFDAIGNYSDDDHETKEQAVAVCQYLVTRGNGEYPRAWPVRVWVEQDGKTIWEDEN